MLLFIIIYELGSCQTLTFTLRAKVVDAISDEPIAFAHIKLQGKAIGTTSNLDGDFELKLNAKNDIPIVISCIGYKSRIVEPADLQTIDKFRLTPQTTQLGTVTIRANTDRTTKRDPAERIVRKAIRRIKKNYSNDPKRFPTFYRHYCSENGNYVRLIEAAITLAKDGRSPYEVLLPQDNLGFDVKQLRRSFDFTENARLSHPPISLNYLLIGDFTAYNYNHPFQHPGAKFTMIDTTSIGGDEVYEIQFKASVPTKQRSFHGKLYIKSDDLAFIKTEVYEHNSQTSTYDSTGIQAGRIALYRSFDEKYYLDRINVDVNALHLSFDTLKNVLDSVVHNSHIELQVTNILTNNSRIKSGREPTAQDLLAVEFDSTFWVRYNTLAPTKLEAQIIKDLSRKLDLQKQFKLFKTVEEGGKSIMESPQFRRLVKKYEETPTYFIIWSVDSPPNFFDVTPHRFMSRKLKRGKMQLVMVSMDPEYSWQRNRELYQLNQAHIIHERIDFEYQSDIIETLFADILPIYCFYGADGHLITDEPPLPSHQDIQFLMRRISR